MPDTKWTTEDVRAIPTLEQHLGHANTALISAGMPEEEAFSLTARVLAAHDAEIAAKALEDAASVHPVITRDMVSRGSVRVWLRARAAALRGGEQS